MTIRTAVFRFLALTLALYAAGTLCRTAAALAAEQARAESLLQQLESAALETEDLRRELTAGDIRQRAWAQYGLVGPGDVVFFDEGAWPPMGQK